MHREGVGKRQHGLRLIRRHRSRPPTASGSREQEGILIRCACCGPAMEPAVEPAAAAAAVPPPAAAPPAPAGCRRCCCLALPRLLLLAIASHELPECDLLPDEARSLASYARYGAHLLRAAASQSAPPSPTTRAETHSTRRTLSFLMMSANTLAHRGRRRMFLASLSSALSDRAAHLRASPRPRGDVPVLHHLADLAQPSASAPGRAALVPRAAARSTARVDACGRGPTAPSAASSSAHPPRASPPTLAHPCRRRRAAERDGAEQVKFAVFFLFPPAPVWKPRARAPRTHARAAHDTRTCVRCMTPVKTRRSTLILTNTLVSLDRICVFCARLPRKKQCSL